jgi:hypothetical protein
MIYIAEAATHHLHELKVEELGRVGMPGKRT